MLGRLSYSASRFVVVFSWIRCGCSSPARAFSNHHPKRAMSVVEQVGTTYIVSPRKETDQTATVIFSHGLGDTAQGFLDVGEMLVSKLPYCKVILPTAPTQPVTMNRGMAMPSWYDITGLDHRANENCDGIEESRQILVTLLQDEHARGIPYSRMVLGGFSQGGALSLYTGLQFPEPLAGIVVLSGYLPAHGKFQLTQPEVPVFHGHGTQDFMVSYSNAEMSRTLVTEKGLTSYTMKTYPIGHTVNMDELNDLMTFLQTVLPPDDQTYVKVKDPADMSVKELKAAIRKAGLESQARGLMEKSDFVKLLVQHQNKS